jgi:hypothetical protein
MPRIPNIRTLLENLGDPTWNDIDRVEADVGNSDRCTDMGLLDTEITHYAYHL